MPSALPIAHAQPTESLVRQFEEFRAKAEKDDAEAQYLLGICYETGEGVKQSYLEAINWYRKAAEQDHLGVGYVKGPGVAQDYVEAYTWFDWAAGAEGAAGVADQSREALADMMSPDQLSHAHEPVKELRLQIAAKRQNTGK